VTLSVPSTNPFYVNPSGGTDPVIVQLDLAPDFGPGTNEGHTRAINVTGGADIRPGGDWSAKNSSGFAQGREEQVGTTAETAALKLAAADSNPATAYNPFSAGASANSALIDRIAGGAVSTVNLDSRIKSVDALGNGTLFTLPGGAVKAALGAEYRNESHRSVS